MIRDEVAESWKEVTVLCAGPEKNVAVVMDAVAEGVVIFGAGTQGRVATRYLKKHGVNILCFSDNDPDKQGTLIDDITVGPPHDSAVTAAPIVLIAARHAVLPAHSQLDQQWSFKANLGVRARRASTDRNGTPG